MSYLTEKLQSLADQCAKDNGFYAACYVGAKDSVLVFAPVMQDSAALHDGPTGFICIEFDKPEYISTDDYSRLMYYFKFYMSNGSIERRSIRTYETLLRRLEAGKLPKKDIEYASYIKEWGPKPVQPGTCVEPIVDPSVFFMFFDVATRLGKKIQFCAGENNSHYVKIID